MYAAMLRDVLSHTNLRDLSYYVGSLIHVPSREFSSKVDAMIAIVDFKAQKSQGD